MLFLVKQQMQKLFFYSLIAGCFAIASCKKDAFISSPDARLEVSDTLLKYDTVFTSTGSITQSFKINNTNNQKLLISKVKLMGGTGSQYKMNVNGILAPEANNIEVAANDSIYVFVTVNINPSAIGLPFVVRDSIQIYYNGNSKFVKLEAFGQNANFLRGKVIKGNQVWTNELPYVILGGIQVDTNATLIIGPGCKIYCNAYSPFIVDGTLKINGTKDAPVIFAGDRLDEDYRDFPASWPGIYFRGESRNSVFNFTTVKNAYQAIVAQGLPGNSNPKITMHQCLVDNAYDAGIYCINSSLDADNSLITNCGSNINIVLGGKYNFTHCTVAAYSTFLNHKKPVLSASNFALVENKLLTRPLDAIFTNCIFWGEEGLVKDEVNIKKENGSSFLVRLDHCLYKSTIGTPPNSENNQSKNLDPLFDSINVSKRYFDFRTVVNGNAPGVNNGSPVITAFTKDLDDKERNNGIPDIGCYEKQ
jgi:hypothetical protein